MSKSVLTKEESIVLDKAIELSKGHKISVQELNSSIPGMGMDIVCMVLESLVRRKVKGLCLEYRGKEIINLIHSA